MAEVIVLDPSEVATARTSVDITPWIDAEGVDWGDGDIAAYMADQSRGSSPVDFRVPNRTVTMPLVVKTVGGTTFADIRSKIQSKAALFQQEGGWLKRLPSSGGTVFADVVNATLKMGGGWLQAHKSVDPDAQLVLECVPDFYGSEIDLGDNVTTTLPELVFTETGIRGDYPGRCRIVVDDDQAISQLGLIWGIRSRHYSASAAAQLAYPASELTAIGTTFGTNWTPLYSTDRDSGTTPLGPLTHTGTYRVWIQFVYAAANPVQFRFVWDVGDFTLPVENDPVAAPGLAGTFALDLGEIRLDAPPTGTHRWTGVLQGKGVVGGETFTLNRIWFVPVDEGYGVLRAPINGDLGLANFTARDEFNQTAGALAGKSAPIGGTYVGAGDPDDFTVETTGKTAQRTAVSDPTHGRLITLNTNMTMTAVQVDFLADNMPASQSVGQGVIARYVDASNYVYAELARGTTAAALNVQTRRNSST